MRDAQWELDRTAPCELSLTTPGASRFFGFVAEGTPQQTPAEAVPFQRSRAQAKSHPQRDFRNHACQTQLK
jgi:hypothetical protein